MAYFRYFKDFKRVSQNDLGSFLVMEDDRKGAYHEANNLKMNASSDKGDIGGFVFVSIWLLITLGFF